MARIGRIISTTAFKLSAIYLVVFTAFALVFVLSISYTANRLFNQQISQTINEEFADLALAWNAAGLPGLVAAIAERSNRPGASLYLLADGMGRIAGNVSEVATEFLARAVEQPATVTYETPDGQERDAMVQVVRLSGGMFLLVGRDTSERTRFGAITRTAIISAAILLVGLGLVSWFFVSRRVLKRIDSVAAATRRIMTGDLAGRLEVTRTNDEFDRLSASVNAMLDRIETLLSGVKEVSDNIAHDLKTPLTRMRNRLESALRKDAGEAEQRQAMQAAIDDADQLIATFNALLQIARIEAGAFEETREDVDALAVVRDVVELYEPVAEEAGVGLAVTGGDPQHFTGNREIMSQAVANLIDNAIRHGRPVDGAKPEVRVAVARDAGDVLISVRDNGPGIPEEERGRVVERFVRLEKSRSTPGTGLGLSLSAALAKLHHGRLELADAGPGLVATIRVPAARPTP